MNYSNVKYNDIANGSGVRTSLFVSGCTHRCKGCFNPETWDFNHGKPFDEDVQQEIFNSLSPNWITGLSVLGGEPMEPDNQRALLPFLRMIKVLYPRKDIWLWTGCTLETDLQKEGSRWYCEATPELLELVDVLVDGEFVEELKDISLAFRGSSNQRIHNLKELRENRK